MMRISLFALPLVLLATALPVAAFLALLSWSLVRSGNVPGGFLINVNLGEINIEPGLAPLFTTNTIDGEKITLSELRGQVVMITFWASWCPPCRQEASALVQVHEEYQSAVKFIGIDIWDHEKDARNYIDVFHVSYPNILDTNGRIAIDYGVTGIPETHFIDAAGNLVHKFVGPLNQARLRAILDDMLMQ